MKPHSLSSLYKAGEFAFDCFMTHSPKMVECLRLAKAAAAVDLAVLITGETGTGKNLLAQAIHNASARAKKPCIVVNCTALSETLMESELFGHERGAFTGADKLRKGRFELADGGTLVLDEIGGMSASAQAKILRVTEYGQFERLGGQVTLQADVRVIALTNRSLEALVADGRFRQDLLYRLREFHLEVFPLRERLEDIMMLCEVFLYQCVKKSGKNLEGLTPEAISVLKNHPWPGNLRELKAVIRRAAALAEGKQIDAADLGLAVSSSLTEELAEFAEDDEDGLSLKAAERWQIMRVLKRTRKNKRQASRLLKISRSTLDRKIIEYNIRIEGLQPPGMETGTSGPEPE